MNEAGKAATGAAQHGPWLTRGVAGVSAASFFSDSGHEIATAVFPAFLTTTLHASPGVLGLIEGVSDALRGISKLGAGPVADSPERRRRMASGGYLVAVVGGGGGQRVGGR